MQVAAELTPSTGPRVAAAIIGAYRELLKRDPPTKSSWLWPLALSANETRDWNAMWNRNIGNVTTSGDPATWFYNPHVSAPLKFLAFDTEKSGALSMLRTLQRKGGIEAADNGDADGWQLALNAYLGAGATYPAPWKVISRLENVQPDGSFEVVSPPSSFRAPVLLVGAAALGLAAAAGYAAYWRREVLS